MSRAASNLVGLVVILSAVVTVALAGAGGYLYWERVQTRAEIQTRDTLPALATQQVPQIFSYDFQTMEDSVDKALSLIHI